MFGNTKNSVRPRSKGLRLALAITLVAGLFVLLMLPAISGQPGRKNIRHIKDASQVRGIVQANILWAQGYPAGSPAPGEADQPDDGDMSASPAEDGDAANNPDSGK